MRAGGKETIDGWASAIGGAVKIIEALVGMVTEAGGAVMDFGKWLLSTTGGAMGLKVIVALLLTYKVGGWFKSIAESSVKALGALLKFNAASIVTTLLWGLFAIALYLVIEDLWTFYKGGVSVTGMMMERFRPALIAISTLVGALALAFIALKIQALLAAVGMVVSLLPLFAILAAVALLGIGIYELVKHWQDVKNAAEDALNWMIDKVDDLIEKLNVVGEALGLGKIALISHSDLSGRGAMLPAGEGVRAPGGPGIYGPGITSLEQPGWGAVSYQAGGGPLMQPAPNIHVGEIHVHGSANPEATAEAVHRRITRTAQKGYVR
jgi:hypothetical protein